MFPWNIINFNTSETGSKKRKAYTPLKSLSINNLNTFTGVRLKMYYTMTGGTLDYIIDKTYM